MDYCLDSTILVVVLGQKGIFVRLFFNNLAMKKSLPVLLMLVLFCAFGVPSAFADTNVTVLVVGGGGGGGGGTLSGGLGGGGGAGGYKTATLNFPIGTYTIVVGNGGAGGDTSGTNPGGIGGDSSISTFQSGTTSLLILSHGGGGGGTALPTVSNTAATAGGSGGGTGGYFCHSSENLNGAGIPGEGNNGGHGGNTCVKNLGSGGGGAGEAGHNDSAYIPTPGDGLGGAGLFNAISGSSVMYARGGNGAGTSNPGLSGAANTGNGGNGGTNGPVGGAGGSGVVIISYPTGSMTATGGTIITVGGNTVHTFTSSGTFTAGAPDVNAAFVPVQPVVHAFCSNGLDPFSVTDLVFITHGWGDEATSSDGWVNQMAAQITSRLPANTPAHTWGVCTHDWHEGADKSLPTTAYYNANTEGVFVGNGLAFHNYSSIHFIGHSAGANLIQTAAEIIKKAATTTKIHLTFLDAYDPNTDLRQYGRNPISNVPSPDWWAEQYVDMRGYFPLAQTNVRLSNAFNFDVTALDPQQGMQIGETADEYLHRVHAWPHVWYTDSIFPGHTRYGFSIASEASSTQPYNTFLPGQECVLPSFGDQFVCAPGTPQYYSTHVINPFAGNLLNSPNISPTGTVTIQDPFHLNLITGSPVWSITNATTTAPENVLTFDYQFLSAAGAQGVLTVFVDNTVVDIIDERNATAGAHSEINVPVGDLAPGAHTIEFRLDPFTAVHSSVQISNVELGLLTRTLVIDTTPPEAKVSVNPLTQDLLVEGTDTQGSTSVTKDVDGNYTVTDQAGHTTKLVFSKMFSAKLLTYAKLTALKYDAATTTTVSTSNFLYVWDMRNTPPMLVSQTIAVNDTFIIKAFYDLVKNRTTVITLKKNVPIQTQAFTGLHIPKLTTSSGVLGYEI